MTEAQKKLYSETKERLRQQGKENHADVIVALAEELDRYKVMNALLERDIADRDEMLEKKVEEIYPEFMRDYNAMRNDLNGVYDEYEALRKECDEIREGLKKEKEAKG